MYNQLVNQISLTKFHSEFELLRFPLTVLVIFEHALWLKNALPEANSDIACNIPVILAEQFGNAFLVGQCVPVFFFISGFLFFRGTCLNVADYKKKIISRTKTLLIPYVCWNLLALSCAIFAIKMIPWLKSPEASSIHFSSFAFFETFWDNRYGIIPKSVSFSSYGFPIDTPLWYVKELLILTVFSPAIGFLITHCRKLFISGTFIVWILCAGGMRESCFYHHSLGLFFFSWGAIMSYSQNYSLMKGKRALQISAILYLSFALIILTGIPYSNLLKELNLIIGTVFAISFSSFLISSKKIKPNKLLSASSFFIYAGHYIILGAIFKITAKLWPVTSGFIFIGEMVATAALTLLILLTIYLIGCKYTPKIINLFTGKQIIV